ncbi:nucleotidyl transferase AbiEii/AbiGii toxin family protein [Candidatus Peregrinibacteria bacterium]|nr:nucleotidyl transferase AbiEii/AbiGii toxin family protein [Candidatus Peregrinibacteria bacterium]
MLIPNPKDALHKAWMARILSAVADDTFLVQVLRFKGGTCAAMRNLINRFSVDLDFDLIDAEKRPEAAKRLEGIFKKLGLIVKEKSQHTLQYFLKYDNQPKERAILKWDAVFPCPQSNDYEPIRLIDIDRVLYCQTVPTMFANKLVSVMNRFEKHGSLAGRDLFDIHAFFLGAHSFKNEIIQERTGREAKIFIPELAQFIQKQFTQTVIDQDLNALLDCTAFQRIRKVLKQEVIMFLKAVK